MNKDLIKKQVVEEFFKTLSYEKKNIVDELLNETPFVSNDKTRETFFLAVKESFIYQYNNSDFFRKFCTLKKFSPENIIQYEDLKKIPPILTDIFKVYELSTSTDDTTKVDFTSSGTSGKKSHISIDLLSGRRLLYSTFHIYKDMGILSENKVNYLMMTYNPNTEDSLATSNSDVIVSYFAPANKTFYAIDVENGEIAFLLDKAVDCLRNFVLDGLPIRILGFPHHTVKVIESYTKKFGKLIVPESSFILTGGGWKGFDKLYKENFDFKNFIEMHTTFDFKNVRDVYSLVEHGVVYLDCENHKKHIPSISQVYVRDPKTLAVLNNNEEGLLQLMTPLFDSYPNLSILTTDFGYVSSGCSCGRGTPYLHITGRASLSKIATCALTADQLIESNK